MEEYVVIVGIVSIIFGILSLVLFFKIWVMTGDVKKIKEKVVDKKMKKSDDDIRKAYLVGDSFSVHDLLIEKLLNELMEARERNDFHKVNDIINNYQPIFEKFNEVIPENILKLKDNPESLMKII